MEAGQQRAADAVREAAFSSGEGSILMVGHKHINALLMCALLKQPLTMFVSHIVEDTLPRILPAYASRDFGSRSTGRCRFTRRIAEKR